MAGSYEYSQMLDLVAQYYGSGSDQWLKVAGAQGATADELLKILQQTPGVQTLVTESGQYAGWRLASQESYGAVSNVGSLVNSNTAGGVASVQSSGTIQVPGQFAESAGKVTVKSGVAATGTKVLQFVSGEVVPATIAVATGLKLGYTIDKILYDINPDIFTYNGVEFWNPDVMKDLSLIYREEDLPLQEKLWNGLWGINPDDNTTQLYAEETQFAYMAGYLQYIGLYNMSSYYEPTASIQQTLEYPDSYSKIFVSSSKASVGQYKNDTTYNRTVLEPVDSNAVKCVVISTKLPNTELQFKETASFGLALFSETPIQVNKTVQLIDNNTGEVYSTKTTQVETNKVATLSSGKRVYYYASTSTTVDTNKVFPWLPFSSEPTISVTANKGLFNYIDIAKIIYEGNYATSGLAGSGVQPDSVNPSLPDTTDIATIISALKQQYPELWDSAVTNDVLQPDGSIKTFTYLPLPTPTSKSKYDTQPTGDGSEQNQKDTDVKPDSNTQIKDSTTTTIVSPPVTPNPPDAGGGDSPTVVPPVGKASSLWSIYNPTLEQVNQFGSWLWSSDFVEQLKKLFSDPMQAIIGLHKVYSPVQTTGQGTIKCGYLDSGVPSKLVSEQYVTVDCGSVDMQEYFGNVFDYPPYTEISIYLPFIGIRQLDPSDIMRSTISVKYHIDVLTGACLAEVNVQRDASGGTLYTFSGDAAVRYPVSSGSYMGIVSGLIGVATSLVSGNLLPALGGATRLHTNVDRSGSFTGNSGAMGSKVPYIIISRPQTAMANKFETLSGYPSNTYTPLSACKGFTQVKYCHVENLSATETEKNEIERLLKEGVIL